MKLYYVANLLDGCWRESEGFRDGPRPLKKLPEAVGVWVFDRPVIRETAQPPDDVYQCITIDADRLEVARYELSESPQGWRQWRIPAEVLNRYPRTVAPYSA